MATAEWYPGDIEGLYRALDGLDPVKLAGPLLRNFATGIIDVTSVYPPPVAASQRTGELGRSWSQSIHGLDVEIRNEAVYAGWVQGEEQVPYHKAHGWLNLFDVAIVHLDKFILELAERAESVWRR
jgi:hypothetical protein